MPYVLYNGTMYMRFKDTESRKVLKCPELAKAHRFVTQTEAARMLSHASHKLRSFKVYMLAEDGTLRDAPAVRKKKTGRSTYRRVKLRRQIYDSCGGQCAICGAALPFAEMTIDHIVPLARGGSSDSSNLQCTCRYCNSIKMDMDAEDFLRKISDIYTFQYTKGMKDGWRKKGVLMLLDRLERMGR